MSDKEDGKESTGKSERDLGLLGGLALFGRRAKPKTAEVEVEMLDEED